MTRRTLLRMNLLTALLLLYTIAPSSLSGQQAQFAADEVLVKFRTSVSQIQIQQTFSNAGLAQRQYFDQIGVYLCSITNEQSVDATVRACQADPNVEYAEPNYIYHTMLMRATPNDPRLDDLYAMNNANDADIDAIEAWDTQTGSKDVLIAVIDTGVDYNHPDLKDNMWVNSGESGDGKENNGVDDDNNGYVDDFRGWDFERDDNDPRDDNGHGTHVAGTIGAVGNNGIGVVGVNWTVSIMPLKFLDANGSGRLSDAIPAVIYAADMGARVLSNSWGGGGFSQALRDAIAYARDKNSVFVAAAGNSSEDNDDLPSYPASYEVENVVSVAASDRNDRLASFSNTGKQSVHLAAPGVDILSTRPGGGYQFLSGTSMATPHVSGVFGLVLAQFPGISYRDAMIRVLGGIDSKGEFNKITSTGGRLNASNAISTDPKVAFITRMEDTDNSDGPYEINAEAIDDGAISKVTLKYHVSGGPMQELDMPGIGGNQYRTGIPGQPLDNRVAYFVEVTDDQGNTSRSPEYSFEVKKRGRCGGLLITGGSTSLPGSQGLLFAANLLLIMLVIWLAGRCRQPVRVRKSL